MHGVRVRKDPTSEVERLGLKTLCGVCRWKKRVEGNALHLGTFLKLGSCRIPDGA